MPTTVSFTAADGASLFGLTENGVTWAQQPGSPGTLDIASNRVFQSAAGGTGADAFAYGGLAPASADYSVTVWIDVLSDVGCLIGPALRMASGAKTAYFVIYNNFGGGKRWELFKYVAGAATSLGTYAQTLTVGAQYKARLQIIGGTLKLFIDDVERISAADSAISAAGFGGLAANTSVTSTTGLHVDTWELDDGAGGTTDQSAPESGAGTDAGSVAAEIAAAETGSGADDAAPAVVGGTDHTAGETAAGTDAGQVAAAADAGDSGAGADAGALSAAAAAAETGGGTDAGATSAALSAAESGAGGDAAAAQAGNLDHTAADTGSGADAALVTGPLPPIRSYSARISPAAAPRVAVAVPAVPRVSLSPSGPTVTLTD